MGYRQTVSLVNSNLVTGEGVHLMQRIWYKPYIDRRMKKRLQISLMATLVMALPAVAEAAGQWSRAQLVIVVMVDNRFQPDHLAFHAMQPYKLRLENHGKELHEFTAPAFLKSATIRDKKQLSNGGTDIVVQPGQSVNLYLYSPSRGHYSLTCADHDWDGMVGEIVVN